MSTQEKKEEMTLTLIEAIETLSQIADLEIDREQNIPQIDGVAALKKTMRPYTVHWLKPQDASITINVIKGTLRVVLKYLQNFHRNECPDHSQPETLEQIKTIMVLVGEAAKNLDKYAAIFQKSHISSVTDLKEYRQLQQFYQNHIAKKINHEMLDGWVMGLSEKTAGEKE
ncbi:MAG: hypothetical protein WCF65_07765, partial [Parachlamydiaceae bacterium]